jgi:UDP-glucose 6-dehydrogenase
MNLVKKENKPKYRVVMIESTLPHAYSGKVDVNIEHDNTICFSVYNNPALYRQLARAIEKYFS